MDTFSQPLVATFCYKSGKDRLVIVRRDGDIEFQMLKHREDLMRILALCNGRRSLAQIRENAGNVSRKNFHSLIDLAEEFGIISDSRDLYLRFHLDSANPMYFAKAMSPDEASLLAENRKKIRRSAGSIQLIHPDSMPPSNLLKLCSIRKSSHAFNGEAVTLEQTSGLLRAMYTVGEQRSTPSAGQLYPLDIYLAVTADGNESLEKGLYRYDPSAYRLNPLKNAVVTTDIIGRILNSHEAEQAGAVIFVAADLQRPATKYANRGYRFALMEAGHAAQNAHLYCAETENLGMVEWGGFQDQMSAQLLGLDYPKQAVLLAIIVGVKDPNGQPAASYSGLSWDLSQQLIGKGKPVEYLNIRHPGDGKHYTLPRVQVDAKYRWINTEGAELISAEECFGSGLAVTSDEAVTKALAEAYERYVSGMLRVDVVSPAVNLAEPWLDPRQIAPLQPAVYNQYGWSEFDPNKKWQWVLGKRHNSGQAIMVPVDLVFYPLADSQLGRMPYFSCTSNGVAAHTQSAVAAEKALLELVERDAISVTWYAKRSVASLPESFLPEDVQVRVRHWVKKGYTTKFLNLTLDSVPVVLAMIYSPERYPSFVAGAAATLQWPTAITKAWDEAEIFLLNWNNRKRVKLLSPKEVFSPLDHGKMYFRGENLGQVQWLLKSKEAKPSALLFQTAEELLKMFNPVLVDITPPEPACDLKVIRAISEKLLPINFGYGNEHIGHSRLNDLGLEWRRKFPSFPHFFA